MVFNFIFKKGFDFSHGNNITPENIGFKSIELVQQLTVRSEWFRYKI
jgi:hypothetical protein